MPILLPHLWRTASSHSLSERSDAIPVNYVTMNWMIQYPSYHHKHITCPDPVLHSRLSLTIIFWNHANRNVWVGWKMCDRNESHKHGVSPESLTARCFSSHNWYHSARFPSNQFLKYCNYSILNNVRKDWLPYLLDCRLCVVVCDRGETGEGSKREMLELFWVTSKHTVRLQTRKPMMANIGAGSIKTRVALVLLVCVCIFAAKEVLKET